jgi:hypothetical protein
VKLDGVGEVIGTRTLRLAKGTNTPSEVLVLVGKPQRLPDHEDYYCPYEIKGAGIDKVRYACGIDALQALLLTLSVLKVELEVLNKDLGGGLSWEFDEKGTFGFPDMPPAAL